MFSQAIKLQIRVITQISAAIGGFNKPRGTYSRKYSTKRYYYGFKRRQVIGSWRRPQISAAVYYLFLSRKLPFGFPLIVILLRVFIVV